MEVLGGSCHHGLGAACHSASGGISLGVLLLRCSALFSPATWVGTGALHARAGHRCCSLLGAHRSHCLEHTRFWNCTCLTCVSAGARGTRLAACLPFWNRVTSAWVCCDSGRYRYLLCKSAVGAYRRCLGACILLCLHPAFTAFGWNYSADGAFLPLSGWEELLGTLSRLGTTSFCTGGTTDFCIQAPCHHFQELRFIGCLPTTSPPPLLPATLLLRHRLWVSVYCSAI